MEEVINSPNNPKIKLAKSLHIKKYRDRHGLYIVEGVKMVAEALGLGNRVRSIIYSQGFDIRAQGLYPNSNSIPLICVTSGIFREISDVESPQGVIAILEKDNRKPDLIFKSDKGLWVILDRIQDPGNLGTIIRTMDAAGGQGVILLEGCVDPYNPKVVRATMGSIFRVPIVEASDAKELLMSIGDKGWQVLGTTMDGEDIFGWENKEPEKPVALVIGNESRGISPEIMSLATDIVSIPIFGGAESLNASVAASIMIYELARRG